MDELEREIRDLIAEALKLDAETVAGLEATTPLFGSGLGLDSLDALEIAMAIGKRYGVQPGTDEKKNQEIFHHVRSLARFVSAHRATSSAAPEVSA